MESSIESRKHKQQPSEYDPFGGIFTRSRSQIYFHRHRSGYAQSGSIWRRNIIKKIVKQQQLEVSVDLVMNQVSVKDLHMRRVFSPTTDGSNDLVSIREVDFEADCKKDDGNPSVSVSEAELGVFEHVVVNLKYNNNNVTEGEGVVVQTKPMVVEVEENKSAGEKNEMSSVMNEVADIKRVMNMNESQQLVCNCWSNLAKQSVW
ncbi:uncharacterized protein LOC118492087 [Helianthus annuus]|uniref:uncharacterized protein LOC118492087 n=1 Tax=Helianthus annuus TaxID=4232 RepID=UPI0016533776|nr:uncharacterized protein LOC118492087 [Helianthus annuus]